jgi:hypothetical protein
VGQRVVALERTLLVPMTAEHGQRLVEFASRHEQRTRALVELLPRERVDAWISGQRQVVGGIRPAPGKPKPFGASATV